MKVVFYSNFLTHHQVPFCLEMQKRLGDDFKFVSTIQIPKWRLDLGFKDLDKEYDFVVRAYENEEQKEKAKKLAEECDIAMIGSIPDDLITERLKQDKITFRYRYRIFIFPDGFFKTIFSKEKRQLFYDRHIKFRKNKNLYMLAANAYGPNDFNKYGLYKNKIYKWGYFLPLNYYDVEKLVEEKEKNKKIEIVWVARFIKWKHPEIVVKLAKKLKKQKYNFEIKMIGTGKLIEKIKKMVKKNKLEDVLTIVGQVPSDEVKTYYEKANIFIATSGSNEGWGAVMNEAMNGACAVVANQKMGSVPYLITHGENGLMYNNFKGLENNVKTLIENNELRKKLSINGYRFITEKWTAAVAANNLIELFNSIIDGRENGIYDGPASEAKKYKRKKI